MAQDNKHSDMKMSDIFKSEPSGIEKFNHVSDSLTKSLNMTDSDMKRIADYGMANLTGKNRYTSQDLEDILTTDKLHSTKERIVVAFTHGCFVSDKANMLKMMKMMEKLGGI